MRIQLHENFRTGRSNERLWHPGYYSVPRDMPQDIAQAAIAKGVASQLGKAPAPENKMLGPAPENKDATPAAPVARRWDGGVCVVAASGPSLTKKVAAVCKGRRCIAVNDAYKLFPFAEILYGGDAEWWDVHEGCTGFAGEKWSTHDEEMNHKLDEARRFGIRLVRGQDAPGFSLDPSVIHYGGNSGFQAINLSILFGATRIVLAGFDMRTRGGKRHFFGDHPAGLTNAAVYEHFIPAFKQAAKVLPAGVEIVNCTPGSALKCFTQMRLEDALVQ